ncbi:MAG: cytochrome c biogenesis protein CcdA [Bacteroidales bacterium]|nr:cytochrome c biogenesis protein CcdA [Bacteroidales bacterium]
MMPSTIFRHAMVLIILLTASFAGKAQILEPVSWQFESEKISEREYELRFTATIDPGWYIYGTDLEPGGPIPTAVFIDDGPGFELSGKLQFPEPEVKYDPNFDMDIPMYGGRVTFAQRVVFLTGYTVKVQGELQFMSCDDQRCLPPDYIDFSFVLEGPEGLPPNGELTDATDEAPQIFTVQETEDSGLGWTFLLGLMGGLLALLTPCVFPMIPLTVSFFLRNAGNRARALRDALFYGFTIIFSYVVLGLAIAMIFGPSTLNALATSPGFNIFFFALLVFFAASFFGAFELTMPSKWSNALDSKADQTGGLIGVILMGLTFVLVSFSCTGPIVGTLLVEAAVSGSVFAPAIGMLGFSLALAIPFSLFALFPTALKSLPKSGGWMNAVKVALGFVVLAFSLKFLSVADAVGQWGLISREVFLVIWIAIFFLMGLYLIGKIRFAHDSELRYLSVPRLMLSIATFAFVFYLIPGLWGAPLRSISSFLPSPVTQEFDLSRMTTHRVTDEEESIYVGASVQEGPHGLLAFTDYYEGLEAARKAGKPVFLDFTGLGCANCRKMEASVWSDPRVLERLRNDFVKISLFVDDRTRLPESEQFVSDALGRSRNIRTIGQKWSVFQAERYGANTQPYYVLLDHDENMLAPPHGYDLNINRYIDFLDTGKKNFRP